MKSRVFKARFSATTRKESNNPISVRRSPNEQNRIQSCRERLLYNGADARPLGDNKTSLFRPSSHATVYTSIHAHIKTRQRRHHNDLRTAEELASPRQRKNPLRFTKTKQKLGYVDLDLPRTTEEDVHSIHTHHLKRSTVVLLRSKRVLHLRHRLPRQRRLVGYL